MTNETQPEGELLNETEAARIIRITPGTLRAWRSRGGPAIPYIRIGRSIRYRLEDLKAFVDANRVA